MVTIGVILGSVRPGRNCVRVSNFVQTHLQKPGVTLQVIDPLALNLPIVTNRYDAIKTQADCPPTLHALQKTLTACDAFVLVSPEYNHTIPPAISNTLAYFYAPEFAHKPVGIVSYSMGPFGGARASVALLPMVAELGMVAVPKKFSVGVVHKSLNEAGVPEKGSEWLPGAFKGFADDIVAYANILKDARTQSKL
ncbi:NADPH-dependent FMN reductase [Chytriomyces cf. hyalinus JEL632]|nr:NADPH-dependent FMN reductase [Chytriomyces cf. hyalinus JEL632]